MPAPSPNTMPRSRALGDCASRQGRTLKRLRLLDKIAITGLSLALVLSACTARSSSPEVTMPTTASSKARGLVSAAPLETVMATQTLPVYWLGKSNGDVFLYREFVPAPMGEEPIVTALRTMMSEQPHDPDYFSVWTNPERLGASISAKNVITVDVSANALSKSIDQGLAERAISQLVYTATAAAAMSGLVDSNSAIQVSILVDGHTGYKAFGHVALDAPLTRTPLFLAPVWIIDPANGTTTDDSPLMVSGVGVSPTGTLLWSLNTLDGDSVGKEYLSGTTSIPDNTGKPGNFTFNVAPPPGRYLLSVYWEVPDQPGVKLGVDSKTVTIAD